MAVDRKQFASTKVTTLKSQEKEVKKQVATSYSNKDKVDWLTIEKGSNKLRIFPAHPESDSFIYPRCTVWLEREISYEKEGEQVIEIVKRPVFNSKVHGGTPKDLVEEYVKFATKMLEEEIAVEQDEETKKKLEDKLATIQHWQNGIKYKTGWCCYANKIVDGQKHFGQIELTPGIKEKLNELSIVEDADDPIQTDPFTDVDDGKAVIVSKTVEAKKLKNGKTKDETKYGVTIEFRGNYALSDKELEDFAKVDPLSKIYKNSFRMRDFELQLEGIKIYDKKNKLGVLDYDAFLDIVEEIKGYYPESDSEAENDSEAYETETGDQFDSMDRNGLKKWIATNCPNKEVVVRTTDDDDEIREKIREFLAIKEEPEVGDEELPEEEAPEEENDLPWDENGNDIRPKGEDKKSSEKKSTAKKTSASADVKAKLGLK